MILHKNPDSFLAAISATSDSQNLAEYMVEKDYWITMLLKRLATFEFKNYVVFKGGTSLSKGFDIIKRFSEDVDIALKPEAFSQDGIHKRPGEAIYRCIKKLKITDFKDISEGKESERSRYKRAYEFPNLFDYPEYSPIHDRVILEVNSFSNPEPTEIVQLNSLIGEYIGKQYGHSEQNKYGLEPFPIAALTPERTFCEKLLAIRRASIMGGHFFSERIRHLYDIFQLCETNRIQSFIKERRFEGMLVSCYEDDKLNNKISSEVSKRFCDYEIFNSPKKMIHEFESGYNNLKFVTFDGTLPSISLIITTFEDIARRLKNFSF